jgi:hypothetical protein
MPLTLLVLLASLILALPASAAPQAPLTTERLYRAAPSTATAAASEPWELFLSPGPKGSSTPDSAVIRVVVRRRGKDAVDALLLTVSATSSAPKSVSRRQVTLRLDAGQREAVAAFKVEAPGCGPAQVVAALFQQGEPLARAERRLTFDCGR